VIKALVDRYLSLILLEDLYRKVNQTMSSQTRANPEHKADNQQVLSTTMNDAAWRNCGRYRWLLVPNALMRYLPLVPWPSLSL